MMHWKLQDETNLPKLFLAEVFITMTNIKLELGDKGTRPWFTQFLGSCPLYRTFPPGLQWWRYRQEFRLLQPQYKAAASLCNKEELVVYYAHICEL